MNLVKLITDQLSGETLGKLSAQLGTDDESVSTAATAAVPALLSGLAGMAARGEGSKKIADVLGGVDAGSMGNMAQLLSGDTNSLMQRGGSYLNSLFGNTAIDGIASAVGRYSGINIGIVKSLLTYLMPLVLGKVAAQWRSQGGTPSALTSLFADQKRNIADAVPAGFSLADIPGLGAASETARAAGQSTRRAADKVEAAASSPASWLLPVAILLLGGFLLWSFLKPRPEAVPVAQNTNQQTPTTVMKPVVPEATPTARPSTPDVARLTDDVRGILKSATDDFASIKDAASAEAAMPKLEELKSKLDAISTSYMRLPEAAQPAIRQLVGEQLTPNQSAAQIMSINGLTERFKTLINDILQRLVDLTMTQRAPSQPATAQ